MTFNTIIQCNLSSSHVIRTYDVFVSFRGEDTRNNFISFLFEALRKKGINAFKDDTNLKKGESIAPELLQAIEGSSIFIVVFSKNYASSTWCLRELAEIRNYIEKSQRRVLPIFYDVDPSEVRKQSGFYKKAFVELEERFREDKEKMEEVQRWREALTQVASLSGWDIRNKPQYAKIEEIVQKIINILGRKFSSLPNDDLVGMESRLGELAKLLHLGSINDVQVVGISGMGGIGKSTLGRALYERISHQYDFCCFIDDVSKTYRDSSILGIQNQLLSQSLNEKNLEICSVSEGTRLVSTRLRNAKALIILDNVDQVGQLKMFTGSRDSLLRECLGGGSKIIVISRDEHILRTYGVDDVYQVHPLNHEDAIQLFCRNAFKGNYIMSDYEELTSSVLSHAQGHPLAIEVLGSSLFRRNISQWRSALHRLRENKSKNIMDVLRTSFDALDDIDKKIFLDIACFFNNHEEKYVKEILDFREFHPEYGLRVLVDKSLITIKMGRIHMHSLLIDLGRCIVQEKSPKEPRKWSRLWDYRDFCKVMSKNTVAKNLEAIVINSQGEFPQTTMRVDALSKMSNLKLLTLHNVVFSGSLNYLSDELGYLIWSQYPFKCLPPSFQPNKLVQLSLRHSSIKQLWGSIKPLCNLRYLDLSHSKNLIEMPNFGKALNLERLNLEGCIQLNYIDPSIGLLRKLILVNLKDCKSLTMLPHFGEALNLETLNLEGCVQLKQINPSIGLLRKLTILNLKDCKNLVSLPNNILALNSLEYLSLSGCSKLYNIHLFDEPRDAEYLKKLCMGEAPIHSQSTSPITKRLFMWPLHLLYSRAHKDSTSYKLPSSPSFSCMRELDLSFCNLHQIPDVIGNFRCLESLNLRGNDFVTLPNLKELSKLYYLNLQHCMQLKYLPELPSQTNLALHNTLPIAGLYIFNCPKLVDWEHCTSMSISWMIQIAQEDHKYKHCEYPPRLGPKIEIILPGSEIPRWFNNQHIGMGSLISIDVSHVMHDNNCIGVACCAIFATRQGKGTILAMGPVKPKRSFTIIIPVALDRDLVTDELDHVWLFYVSQLRFIKACDFWGITYHGDLKIEFELKDEQGFHIEVKKYGYRRVYKQDIEPPNLTMMYSGNWLARKRKFLAIEENKL